MSRVQTRPFELLPWSRAKRSTPPPRRRHRPRRCLPARVDRPSDRRRAPGCRACRRSVCGSSAVPSGAAATLSGPTSPLAKVVTCGPGLRSGCRGARRREPARRCRPGRGRRRGDEAVELVMRGSLRGWCGSHLFQARPGPEVQGSGSRIVRDTAGITPPGGVRRTPRGSGPPRRWPAAPRTAPPPGPRRGPPGPPPSDAAAARARRAPAPR